MASAQPLAPTTETPKASPSEISLLNALAANAVTSPYLFETSLKSGRVQLWGRVGTKEVYDQAIRVALDLGIAFDDHLVIDTAATLRAASGPGTGGNPQLAAAGAVGAMPPRIAPYSRVGGVPYIYPPPLFGFYDDPFYGFEPPIISYPPFWGALSRSRLPPADVPYAPNANMPRQTTRTEQTIRIPAASGREEGRVEIRIGPDGDAVVTGVVPTDADRAEVEEKLSRLPDVRSLKSEITVRSLDEPPPPPTPAFPDDPPRGGIDPGGPPISNPDKPEADDPAVQGGDSDQRLQKSIARRPALDGLPIRATLADGVATISGKVPSIFEAMLAFRAVQKTPGVHEVVDRLQFTVPPPKGKNPLVDRGRPEDVEPYLEAQIQRQLGETANVDRVRVHGDQLEVRGTAASGQDQARINAILRSMPALRGFQLVSEFLPE
jgi:hypothetical protein